MAKFTDALKFWTKPLTRGVRAITGNLDEQEQGQLKQEQEKLFQSILNTTQPFRMGANTLVQNYGPAFRVLTGGDPLTPGPVEQFTREALTPEEQDYLERKPYMAALKSSVGMGSSLMPFTSRAVPAATLGARTAQIAGRGLLEGLAGGFGYSREGKELQDTLVGGGIGMGGELLGNYAFDPSYRSMVNQGFQNANTGTYQAAVGNLNDVDSLEALKKEAMKYDSPEEFVKAQGDVYYHGTSADFDSKDFKGGYLTGDKTYAGVYQSPSASSISYGEKGIKNKRSGQPRVLEFTIDKDANMFDYTNPEHRKLLEDYWGSWSMSGEPVVGSTGQLDWTEGENLVEFFDEKGLKFDGIKLDEGGGFDPETRIELKRAPSVRIINPEVLKDKFQLTDIWKQAQENLTIPPTERMADSRTFGEAIKDDTLHFAKIEGEGFGPEEYIALGGKELPQPKEKFVKPKIKTGTLNDMSKRLAMGDGDTLESFLEKYRRLGIVK